MTMAHNRTRPRARTWTLETLDRAGEYRLHFDRESFRWEVIDLRTGEHVVTRVSINRRSAWEGDRPAPSPAIEPLRAGGMAGGPEAASPPAVGLDGGRAPERG